MTTLATSRVFDVAVVVHALTAVVAFVVVLTLRAAASGVRSGGEPSAAARRSFRGRPELAGRSIYLVLLTGLWALGASSGTDSLGSPFVVAGLGLWVVAVALLESMCFPAQAAVSRSLDADRASASRAARRMLAGADAALAAIALAAVVMVLSQA